MLSPPKDRDSEKSENDIIVSLTRDLTLSL